jgi:hypothetical protein
MIHNRYIHPMYKHNFIHWMYISVMFIHWMYISVMFIHWMYISVMFIHWMYISVMFIHCIYLLCLYIGCIYLLCIIIVCNLLFYNFLILWNLISTCASECDWLFHWQHKLWDIFRKHKYKLPSSNQSICVGSFNMDWRILVFYPEPEARDNIY